MQNPQPTYTVYISHQYCRGCFFLSQVWLLYNRIMVTQWPIMVPILHCSVHLSPMFKKKLVVTFNVVIGVWHLLCVLPSSVLFVFYWRIRIYILRVFTLVYFKVFLVLHFMLHAFQSVSSLKVFTKKSGISEEYLQHVWLSRDLTHTYIHTGCFTTLGHNCRRWFPRSLWSKKFIQTCPIFDGYGVMTVLNSE